HGRTEPVTGRCRARVLTENKRGQKKTSPPGPLSIHGEGVIGFGIWRAVRGSARVLALAGNKAWVPTI
ncbi:MAG: hypothetical protein ACKOS8_19520, partial [Gemmataceae bacterium]